MFETEQTRSKSLLRACMPTYRLRLFRGLVQTVEDQILDLADDRTAIDEGFALAAEFGRDIFHDLQVIPSWKLEIYGEDERVILRLQATAELRLPQQAQS